MWRDDLLSEARSRGHDEGYHNGGHIADLDIAMRMLKYGCPLDQVARITELTPEKVFELQERVRTSALKA
ncbi:MAG: hypothetical protein IK079_03960 [Desulfovibrio sp.]|nr:hypothetical protein [Desulfovibrio sp.]